MRQITIILITIGLVSCRGAEEKKVDTNNQTQDFEALAFEGINVDFKFKSNNPTFGDLFLIVGYEHPSFSPNSKEFEKLQDLDFDQVDDYFGIRNNSNFGGDVKIWLFPLIDGHKVYHNKGPFDAIRLSFVVIRNEPNTKSTFKKAFHLITSNLDVIPTLNGQPIESYEIIEKTINEIIQYCRLELKVEPGSNEALQLEW